MEFHKKYMHVGISYPGVPKGWVPIVEKAIVEIEKEMWPQRWMPMFVKRWIHYLATGNSVVRVKFWWAHRLRTKLTGGQMIQDIKEKYATLRIYGYAGTEMDKIIERATKECDETCQKCGGKEGVDTIPDGRWYENLCVKCHHPTREVITEKYQ